MIDFHIRKKSKLTIASMPIEGSQANQFGVAEIDGDSRIKKISRKADIVSQ